jgi:ketosteroid isomerase-like protein
MSAWEGYRTGAEEYRELDAERVLVLTRSSGRGKRSGIELSQVQPRGAMVFHIRDGKVTHLTAYLERDRAIADLGLEEYAMADESTTPDLAELWRRAVDAFARGDSDEAAAAYAGRAVFDLSRLGIGIFEGREAIRGLFEDWVEPYEEYQAECEEFLDLGNGVNFAVLLHGGRPGGRDGFVDVRHSYTMTWRHGLIEPFIVYADIDEARAAAERLAEERAQADG